MKLRLNCHIKDLAFWFNVAVSTVSDIFHKLVRGIVYPFEISDQVARSKTCYANMPQIFKRTLIPIINDCSKIFIERPLAFQARAQTLLKLQEPYTLKC